MMTSKRLSLFSTNENTNRCVLVYITLHYSCIEMVNCLENVYRLIVQVYHTKVLCCMYVHAYFFFFCGMNLSRFRPKTRVDY